MEYDARTTTVLTGTCGGCGHQLTVLQEGAGPGTDQPGTAGGPDAARSWKTAAPAAAGPPCQACGAPLTFRSSGGPGIEATCTGCGAVSSYVPGRDGTPRVPAKGRASARAF